jgi:hypothetical protein
MSYYDSDWRIDAAVREGDIAGVRAALAAGPVGPWDGEPALIQALKHAVLHPRLDIVRLLIAEMKRRGFKFYETMQEGLLAMAVRHDDVLEQLLADGLQPQSARWSPALCAAVEQGRKGAALRLLRAGAHAGHLGGAEGNQRLVGWLQEEVRGAEAEAERLRISNQMFRASIPALLQWGRV